eukprot:gene6373-7637_t
MVGISGVARSGKSTLMNTLFPEDTPTGGCFRTTDNSLPCTSGIWMSTTPVKIGEHQVMLIDSEGLDRGDTTSQPEMLCLLSMMCSVLVFNEVRDINTATLARLEALTAVRSLVSNTTEEHWPALCFVVRDHRLKLPVSEQSYLEQHVLELTGDRHDAVRKAIRSCFQARRLVTLPTPSDDDLNGIPRLPEGKFKGKVQELHGTLQALLDLKHPDACAMDGSMLVDFIMSLVKGINTAAVTDIPSLTQAMHDKRCRLAYLAAFDKYEEAMQAVLTDQLEFVSEQVLDSKHELQSQLAHDHYNNAVCNLLAKSQNLYRKDLRRSIQHSLMRLRESKCGAVAQVAEVRQWPVSLGLVYNTLFLPMSLPSGGDGHQAEEDAVIAFMRVFFMEHEASGQPVSEMHRCGQRFCDLHYGELNADNIHRSLRSVSPGEHWAMYLQAQNAVVLLKRGKRGSDGAVLCSWEVQAAAGSVMGNSSSPRQQLPCVIMAVEWTKVVRRSFAELLKDLATEEQDKAMPKSRKGGQACEETRDVSHPMMATEWLLAALGGSPFASSPDSREQHFTAISKKMRDEVRYSEQRHPEAPWRRAATWLALKGVLHLVCVNTCSADVGERKDRKYKVLRMQVLSEALQQTVRLQGKGTLTDHDRIPRGAADLVDGDGAIEGNRLRSSAILEGARKLARAQEKLACRYGAEPLVRRSVDEAKDAAMRYLKAGWAKCAHATISTEMFLEDDDAERDCQQSLLAARATLQDMMECDINAPLSVSVCDPSACTRSVLGIATAAEARSHLDCLHRASDHHDLLDAIHDIEQAAAAVWRPMWQGSPEHDDSDEHARELLTLMTELMTAGRRAFVEDTLGESRTILASLALVLYVDWLACRRHPLLTEHKVEVQLGALETLFLATRAQKELLHALEEYVIHRNRHASQPSTVDPHITSASFGVRYASQSSSMQTLLEEIELKCQRAQEEKREEVRHLREKLQDLRARRRGQYCDCHNSRHRCDACCLDNQIGNCKTSVHEKLLPEGTADRHAVAYELQQPGVLSCQRDALLLFVKALCGEWHTRDVSKGAWVDEPRLCKWATSLKGAIQLGSKSVLSRCTHYYSKLIHVDTSTSFIVSHGYNTWLMHEGSILPFPRGWEFQQCKVRFREGSRYASMLDWVNGWQHSENDVIARKNEADERLSLGEYAAFGKLRAGCRLQLVRLVQALAQGSLSLEREEVTLLVMATLWQVGPRSRCPSDLKLVSDPRSARDRLRNAATQLGLSEWRRQASELLASAEHVREICRHASDALSACRSNWSNWHALLTVVLIARAATEHGPGEAEDAPFAVLREAREVAQQWIAVLLELTGDVTDEDRLQELQRTIADVAAIGALTFGAGAPLLLSTVDDCAAWLYFTATLHNNLPPKALQEPSFRRGIFHLVALVGQLVAPAVHLLHAAGANRFLPAFWSAARSRCNVDDGSGAATRGDREQAPAHSMESATSDAATRDAVCVWTRYTPPADRWYRAVYIGGPSSQGSAAQTAAVLQLDVVRGVFLVDGLPTQRLPEDITQHPLFRRFFGDAILVVQPDLNGKLRTARPIAGADFVFKRGSPFPVIVEQRGAVTSQLVPHTSFVAESPCGEDFPHAFIHSHSHWLIKERQPLNGDAADARVYFRPVRYNHPDFSAGLDAASYVLELCNGAGTLRSTVSGHRIVDIRSRTFIKLYRSALHRVTPRAHMHVTRGGDSGVLSVQLPRLQNIRFMLRDGARLESAEYAGMRIALEQNFGALLGLRHGLVLERADTEHPVRVVLVPHGKVSRAGAEVRIDIEELRHPPLFRYDIREDLQDLRAQTERIASIYLARLHQMTSGLLPDPLTGRTGAAQAMAILRSGHCCGNVLTSIDGCDAALALEAKTLVEMGCESPVRRYYPEHLRVMEDNNLPAAPLEALSMHNGYAFLARLRLQEMRAALACVGREAVADSWNGSIPDECLGPLSERAYLRRRQAYPQDVLLTPEEEAACFSLHDAQDARLASHAYAPPLPAGSCKLDEVMLRGVACNVQNGAGMPHGVLARARGPCLLTGILCGNVEELRGRHDRLEAGAVSGGAIRWATALWQGSAAREECSRRRRPFCDMWIILYQIARNRILTEDEQQAFGFLLTWLAQEDAAVEPHIHNLITVQRARSAFQDLHPPPHRHYVMPHEREYIATYVSSAIKESLEGFSEAEPERDTQMHNSWRLRRQEHFRAVESSRASLSQIIRRAWDSGGAADPGDLRLNKVQDAPGLASSIASLFTRWRHAQELHAFAMRVTTTLRGIAGEEPAPDGAAEAPPSSGVCLHDFQGAAAPEQPAFQLQTRVAPLACHFDSEILDEAMRIVVEGRIDGPGLSLTAPPGSPPVSTVEQVPPLPIPPLPKDDQYDQYSEIAEKLLGLLQCSWAVAHEHTGRQGAGLSAGLGAAVTPGKLRRRLESVAALRRWLWSGICDAHSSGRGLEAVGLWDSVTPYTVLLSVGQAPASAPGASRHVCVAFALAVRDEQRLRRCLFLASGGPGRAHQLRRELASNGCEGWGALEFPEFLLFEVDNDVCIRRAQAEVARNLLRCDAENQVLQLNMGEGKTAVIMPIVLAAAARGEQVVRATVMSSLRTTNAADWQRSLGGLLARRVYPMWCRRDLPISAAAAKQLMELCDLVMRGRHVFVTVPESRLSLENKALELALPESLRRDLGASSAIHEVLRTLRYRGRDFLDESDALLSPKYQLVYTVGDARDFDGGQLRWAAAAATL